MQARRRTAMPAGPSMRLGTSRHEESMSPASTGPVWATGKMTGHSDTQTRYGPVANLVPVPGKRKRPGLENLVITVPVPLLQYSSLIALV